MADDTEPTCPRCREVLKMLIAHKHELELASNHLEESQQRVDDQALYVHTMALILKGTHLSETPTWVEQLAEEWECAADIHSPPNGEVSWPVDRMRRDCARELRERAKRGEP